MSNASPPRSAARTLGVFQVSAAAMLLVILATLPASFHRNPAALVVLAVSAAGLGVASFSSGTLALRAIEANLLLSTAAGSALVITQRSNVYAFVFFLVVVFAVCYLPLSAAVFQIAIAAVSHLVLLMFVQASGLTTLEWLLTMIVLAVPVLAIAASRAAMRQVERNLRGVLEATPDGLTITDRGGRIVAMNQSVTRLFGYTEDELVGHPVEMLMPQRFHRHHRNLRDGFATAGRSRLMEASSGIVGRRRDGSEFPLAVSLSLQPFGGQQLVITTIRDNSLHEQLLFAERTAREEAEALRDELAVMATTDGLTGLLNRRELNAVARSMISLSHRSRRPLSCLLVDLDNFKEVNDAAGHLAGDALLRDVASYLRRTVRESDVVARYGGDEFVALLPDTDTDGAAVIGDELRNGLAMIPLPREMHHFRGFKPTLSASIGIATCRGSAQTPDSLFATADRALYNAKRQGRNRVDIATT